MTSFDTITDTIKSLEQAAYQRGLIDGRRMANKDLDDARVSLGKRFIDRKTVALKLGWSTRHLDRQRRLDDRFPKPKTSKPQWLECDIDRYMDGL
jgi:predicted DNA-binding transcriptional regulator AlpA